MWRGRNPSESSPTEREKDLVENYYYHKRVVSQYFSRKSRIYSENYSHYLLIFWMDSVYCLGYFFDHFHGKNILLFLFLHFFLI